MANKPRGAVDWLKIKKEYLKGDTSYNKLAEKYGISKSAVNKHAKRERWQEEMYRAVEKRDRVALEKVAEQMAQDREVYERAVSQLLAWVAENDGAGVDSSMAANFQAKTLATIAKLRGYDKTPLDTDEQRARIDALRARTEAQKEQAPEAVTVEMSGGMFEAGV